VVEHAAQLAAAVGLEEELHALLAQVSPAVDAFPPWCTKVNVKGRNKEGRMKAGTGTHGRGVLGPKETMMMATGACQRWICSGRQDRSFRRWVGCAALRESGLPARQKSVTVAKKARRPGRLAQPNCFPRENEGRERPEGRTRACGASCSGT
jgi:hypothetical protein